MAGGPFYFDWKTGGGVHWLTQPLTSTFYSSSSFVGLLLPSMNRAGSASFSFRLFDQSEKAGFDK